MGTLTARQFRVRAPGQAELADAPVSPPGPGDVLIRTCYSGISRGTESLVFRGEVPVSQHEVMRAPFQQGDFPGPVTSGYASVGRVLEHVADGTDAAAGGGDLTGRLAFCLYPHQDLYSVPATAITPLPDDVPPERAVLAANLETAVNVLWDARPAVGDRVVVIGAGVVGLLVAWLCRPIAGIQLTVVDTDPARRTVAEFLGLAFADGPPADATADLVIHASGNPAGLAAALTAAGPEATIVEASWYGTHPVPLPLGEAFHSRRLTIKSSQVGHVPPDRAPRWTRARRLQLAIALLRDPQLDALISGESPFDELPQVMAQVSAPGSGVLCHRIRYPDL